MSKILEVSKKTVRRHMARREGVFFCSTAERVYLVGYRRVYARFGAVPSQRQPAQLDRRHWKGRLKNWRRCIAAVCVARIGGGARGEAVMVNRHFLAEKLGVSLPTLRAMQREGWIEAVPVVRIVRMVPAPTHLGGNVYISGVAQIDRSKAERVWDLHGGDKAVVRQFPNLYRSRFSLAELPEVSDDPMAPVGALEAGRDLCVETAVYTGSDDAEFERANAMTLIAPPPGWGM